VLRLCRMCEHGLSRYRCVGLCWFGTKIIILDGGVNVWKMGRLVCTRLRSHRPLVLFWLLVGPNSDERDQPRSPEVKVKCRAVLATRVDVDCCGRPIVAVGQGCLDDDVLRSRDTAVTCHCQLGYTLFTPVSDCCSRK